MMTTSVISLALVLFLVHLTFLSGLPDFPYHKCFREGTYQNNSPYQINLNTLLSTMLSNTTDDGFYDLQHGQEPDIVQVRGLCRGDVNQTTCQNCLNDAKTRLPTLCPIQKEAFGYYDYCTLYYASNRRVIKNGKQPRHSYNNPAEAKDKEKFTSALTDLMQTLKSQASGDSDFKVAVGGKVADESENVYGLVQCSPDLSTKECNDCLDDAMSEIPVCCRNKIGGRVIKLDCNLRFETVQFYYDI